MIPNNTLFVAAAVILGDMMGPAVAWQAMVYDNRGCELDSTTSYFTYHGEGQSPCMAVGNNTSGGDVDCYYATHAAGGLACGDGTSDTIDTLALFYTGFVDEKKISVSVPEGTECTGCFTRAAYPCSIHPDLPTCFTFRATCRPTAEIAWNQYNNLLLTCRDV